MHFQAELVYCTILYFTWLWCQQQLVVHSHTVCSAKNIGCASSHWLARWYLYSTQQCMTPHCGTKGLVLSGLFGALTHEVVWFFISYGSFTGYLASEGNDTNVRASSYSFRYVVSTVIDLSYVSHGSTNKLTFI